MAPSPQETLAHLSSLLTRRSKSWCRWLSMLSWTAWAYAIGATARCTASSAAVVAAAVAEAVMLLAAYAPLI